MRVASLYRYPVKGLSPERLDSARLTAGAYWPGDRLYAVENGPAGFDPEAPRHQPKIKFLMLMRNASLARLRTRYNDETATLTVTSSDGGMVTADLSSSAGRLVLEAFLRQRIPRELRGPPKVLSAPDGFRFTDSRSGFVSILNLASVSAVEALVGRPVDPRRFRANILVDDLPAWAEFDLVGHELRTPSGLRLKVTKRIVRCAATDVDPETGERDLSIPPTLMRRLGHADCGIYAEVTAGGEIRPGDVLAPADPVQPSLPFTV